MKVVIYTAIFGSYDTLKDPLITHPDVEFIYFSEKKLDHLSIWQYRPPMKDLSCPVKNNRFHKMHPHLLFLNDSYEASVYLDANIFIGDSFIFERAIELINKDVAIALVNHPNRYCSFQELETIFLCKLISNDTYKKTHQFLTANTAKNQGLYEANLIFRNHRDSVIQSFCNDWWHSFLTLCNRDQVLLPHYLNQHQLIPELFFSSPLKNTRNHASLITMHHSNPPKQFDADYSLLKENYLIPAVWHLPINKVLVHQLQMALKYNANLDTPRTFNEHINALKQSPPSSFQTQLSDKLALKSVVKRMPFNIHTPTTLCVGHHLDEILDHDLPSSFMLKANHSSGDTWYISDKTNITTQLKTTINASIAKPYGDASFEPNYLNIPRYLFAEEYLPPPLLDYKAFVFNGTPMLIQADVDRDSNHTRCFYDTQWRKQPYSILQPLYTGDIPKPMSLDLMLEVAGHIGQHFAFVRVDFYDVDGTLYLGDVTFFPGSGYEPFSDLKYDYLVGQYFKSKGVS